MTDQVLTQTPPTQGLSAEDAAVFERVWSRVMAGREQSMEENTLVPAQQNPAPALPAGRTDQLLEHIRMQTAGWRASQALARRATGSMARVLSSVAAEERRQLARLAAAWYILTGQRWRPEEGGGAPVLDLMEGLRQRYLQQQHAARLQEQAAGQEDEGLRALYTDLAGRNREHARTILRLLEQMQM